MEELLRFGVAVTKLEDVADCDAVIESDTAEDNVFCGVGVIVDVASPDRDAAEADAASERCGVSEEESVATCDIDAASVMENPSLIETLPDAELDGCIDVVAPILEVDPCAVAEATRLDEDTVRDARADAGADADAHSDIWSDALGCALELEVADKEAAPLVSAEDDAL